MAYRVDTGMQLVQAAGAEPPAYGARLKAEAEQLASRHHSVLTLRKASEALF